MKASKNGGMTLSLCMIVKNEAENLPSCLNSVRGVVDEIVIVDTGSTDDTVAIAQQFQAQVHHFSWNYSFADARNESLKYATGDWILVLDADERLAESMGSILKQVIQQENALVVNLVRQEIGAAQSPYSLVSRLFRNHPDIRFTRPYHAMVDDSVAQILQREPHWQVLDLQEVAILHEGYRAGAIARRNKLETARQTMEGFLAHHPNDPYVCSKLGALYVQLGEIQQGIDLLERGLQRQEHLAATIDAPVQYELHYHLGIAYNHLQHPDQAEQHYQAAVDQPLLPLLKLGAYNNLGNLRQAKGDWATAKATYETCLDIDPNFAIAHYNLGMTLKAMGRLPDAIAHYQQAIQLNPDHAEAYQNLGVAWLKLGRVPDSLTAFRQAIALHDQNNPTEAQRLRQGLESMGFQI